MRWRELVVTLSALPIFQPAQGAWLKQHVYVALRADHAGLGFVVQGDIAKHSTVRARTSAYSDAEFVVRCSRRFAGEEAMKKKPISRPIGILAQVRCRLPEDAFIGQPLALGLPETRDLAHLSLLAHLAGSAAALNSQLYGKASRTLSPWSLMG